MQLGSVLSTTGFYTTILLTGSNHFWQSIFSMKPDFFNGLVWKTLSFEKL